MKNILAILLIACTLTACDMKEVNRQTAYRIVNETTKVCKGGVKYYFAIYDRSAIFAPVYTKGGKLELCEEY